MSNSVAAIDTVLSEIRELKQRVRDLERANRILGAIPRGESIRVYDADGDRVAIIGGPNGGSFFYDSSGRMIGAIARDGNGDDGIFFGDLLNTTSNYGLLWDPVRGLVHPARTAGFQRMSDPLNVTSATYFEVAAARVNMFSAKDVEAEIYVLCPVGTTGNIQFTVNGGGTVTRALQSDGVVHLYQLQWSPTLTLGTGPYIFKWFAQRTGGTDALVVYPPHDMSMSVYDNASGAGFWTVF